MGVIRTAVVSGQAEQELLRPAQVDPRVRSPASRFAFRLELRELWRCEMTMVSRVKESCADLALPGCKSSRRPTGPQEAGTDLSKNLRAVSC